MWLEISDYQTNGVRKGDVDVRIYSMARSIQF